MYEKSTVVGLKCLAILATVIGSGLAWSVVSNATKESLSTSNNNSTNELASYRQATITPSVMTATAMMATAIGLAATLRQQASSEVDRDRKRQRKPKAKERLKRLKRKKTLYRNQKIHSGAVKRLSTDEEKQMEMKDPRRNDIPSRTKTENGVDIDEWKKIDEVIRAQIGFGEDLEKWEEIDGVIRRRINSGLVANWGEIQRLLGERSRSATQSTWNRNCNVL